MGDVLHAMPAVAALREAHPEWFISWAIEPRWSELLQAAGGGDMPLVDAWQGVPTQEWQRRIFSGRTLGEVRALRRGLPSGELDLCVDMRGFWRWGAGGRSAGAALFGGAANPRERIAGWL